MTGSPVPVATPPPPQPPQPQLALRVKELNSLPATPGAEILVTICHYTHGPAKFAMHNRQHRAALQQLIEDIQVSRAR